MLEVCVVLICFLGQPVLPPVLLCNLLSSLLVSLRRLLQSLVVLRIFLFFHFWWRYPLSHRCICVSMFLLDIGALSSLGSFFQFSRWYGVKVVFKVKEFRRLSSFDFFFTAIHHCNLVAWFWFVMILILFVMRNNFFYLWQKATFWCD